MSKDKFVNMTVPNAVLMPITDVEAGRKFLEDISKNKVDLDAMIEEGHKLAKEFEEKYLSKLFERDGKK